MPDANYGYGYPFYNFYAPLSIYIAAFFRLVGFSYVGAVKMAQLSGFIVAAWAMFALGRRWLGGAWPGLLAAAAYSLAPFHLVNIYVRGDSLAEFWAMALYPLVFLTLDWLIERPRTHQSGLGDRPWKSQGWPVARFALAYGALILSHNISALILSPFILLFIILRLIARQGLREKEIASLKERVWAIRWPILALLLGLAVSAWFWLPALAERSLAQLGPVTSGYFHFSNHFRELSILKEQSLVQSGLIFDYDVAGGGAFRMGLVQTILIIAGLISLLLPHRFFRMTRLSQKTGLLPATSIRLFLLLGLLTTTFMITPLSEYLWEQLPLLSFAQFPWRFLSIQALMGALVIGALARFTRRDFIVPSIIALLLVSALAQLKVDFLVLFDDDVTPERIAQYEWFTGNIGSTVSAEYLPDSVQPRPYTSAWLNNGQRDSVRFISQERAQAENLFRSSTGQEWLFNTGEQATQAVLPTLNWPEWTEVSTSLPRNPITVQSARGSGLVQIEVPSQDSTVRLELQQTPIRLVAEWLSLAALLAIGWSFFASRAPRLRRWHGILLITLLITAVGTRLWPEKSTTRDDLTWDFAQMAFLHHDEDGIWFEDGTLMDSYHYSSDIINAGDNFSVTINWRQVSPGQVEVALTSPAANRFDDIPVIASISTRLEEGAQTFQLEIPQNSPDGLFVPRVILNENRPLTASGQPRGDLFLRPVRVNNVHELASSQGPDIDVRPVLVNQRNATMLDIQLQWLTQAPVTHNYNFSIRLMDTTGVWVAQMDQQPGYGYQPSTIWPPGRWVNDWLALPLPADLPGKTDRQPLTLVIALYEVADGEVVLIRPLGSLEFQDNHYIFIQQEPVYQLPESVTRLEAVLSDQITLRGYKLNQGDAVIDLTLYWQALSEDRESYTHFIHLVDSASGAIVAQHDSLPQYNSYPTSLWNAGEIVADHLTLDIGDVAPGRYHLELGLYHLVDGQIVRLPLNDPDTGRAEVIRLPEDLVINRH